MFLISISGSIEARHYYPSRTIYHTNRHIPTVAKHAEPTLSVIHIGEMKFQSQARPRHAEIPTENYINQDLENCCLLRVLSSKATRQLMPSKTCKKMPTPPLRQCMCLVSVSQAH